jgi:RecA-family ATPase
MTTIFSSTCKDVIRDRLIRYGKQSASDLREACQLFDTMYSVEAFNAALNDLMQEFIIRQVAIDVYDLCYIE